MVVNHVKDHRDPAVVARLHEALQIARSAVRRVHSVELHRVITPVEIRGRVAIKRSIFMDGHNLDTVNAQIFQKIQLLNGVLKGTCGLPGRDIEGTDMQLIGIHLAKSGLGCWEGTNEASTMIAD